jgi:hypothetical protein
MQDKELVELFDSAPELKRISKIAERRRKTRLAIEAKAPPKVLTEDELLEREEKKDRYRKFNFATFLNRDIEQKPAEPKLQFPKI